jgi:hypothetical protein
MAHERGSGMRSPVNRWQLLAAVVATGVIVGATVAWAGGPGPTFSDVPATHPFYDDVEWMAAAGITNGFDDGTYRPTQPVTRQAMSAFMRRLYDFQEDFSANTGGDPAATSSTTFQPIPGAGGVVEVPPGAAAYIVADFTTESLCTGPSGYCKVRLTIDTDDDGSYFEMFPAVGDEFGFDSTNSGAEGGASWESHSVRRYWTIGDGGCVCRVRVERAVSIGTTVFNTGDWLLTVETDLRPSDGF